MMRRGLIFLLIIVAWPGAAGIAAPTPPQETFTTPEQAADALAAAWQSGEQRDLLAILGPHARELVSSGDAVADRAARARLADEYRAKHALESQGGAQSVLLLGAAAFPYPIPIVKRGESWYFDTARGAEEILNRRIGRNEINAIRVCLAYVEAQRDYAALDPQRDGKHHFAARLASSPGRRDGLYWPTGAGERESPLGPLVASAEAEGYRAGGSRLLVPFHGYHFRILSRQGPHAPGGAVDYRSDGGLVGGFALLAFPAKYGDSGVMTFVVNQDGIVFEKNLGPATARLAREITAFDPDSSWQLARLPASTVGNSTGSGYP